MRGTRESRQKGERKRAYIQGSRNRARHQRARQHDSRRASR